MSECKHEIMAFRVDVCAKCGQTPKGIKAEQERDELQAQVAVLRGALEEVGKGHIESRFDHEDGRFVEVFVRDVHIVIDQALELTPAEAAERVQKLVEALEDAVSETENGERLSEGFCSAAKAALSDWRRDK